MFMTASAASRACSDGTRRGREPCGATGLFGVRVRPGVSIASSSVVQCSSDAASNCNPSGIPMDPSMMVLIEALVSGYSYRWFD